MEARGKIVNLDLDFVSHKLKLTIQLDNQMLVGYDEIKEEVYIPNEEVRKAFTG